MLRKLLVLLLLEFSLGAPSSVFDQRVDHFADHGTFHQRYTYSEEFVKTSKPQVVLLHLTRSTMLKGEMVDFGFDISTLADKTHSIMASLELRFYGKSFPLTSPTLDDLNNLLTIDQTIEDLVTFREFLIKEYKLDGVRFVLMGCSYAGSLAAWARVKYPDVFLGAVASCPVLDLKYEFPEFKDAVAANYADTRVGGHPDCLAFIKRANSIIETRMKTPGGRHILERIFGLEKSHLDEEKTRLFWLTFSPETMYNQYNNPSSSDIRFNIEEKCLFVAKDRTAAEPLEVYDKLKGAGPTAVDLDSYIDLISQLKKESNLDYTRIDFFQRCSQWALFLSCNPGSNCPFVQDPGILGTHQSICQDAFGFSEAVIKKKIADIIDNFGGRGLKKTPNIIVITGEMDPWKAAGEIDPSTPGPIKYEVPLASHCYIEKPEADKLPEVEWESLLHSLAIFVFDEVAKAVQSWTEADTVTMLHSNNSMALNY